MKRYRILQQEPQPDGTDIVTARGAFNDVAEARARGIELRASDPDGIYFVYDTVEKDLVP